MNYKSRQFNSKTWDENTYKGLRSYDLNTFKKKFYQILSPSSKIANRQL